MLGWVRFTGSWFGLSALWSTTTVCPICGQPICGFSLLVAGMVGFFGAGILFVARNWSRWMSAIRLASSRDSRTPGKIDEV